VSSPQVDFPSPAHTSLIFRVKALDLAVLTMHCQLFRCLWQVWC
jgi:hypothetical protein